MGHRLSKITTRTGDDGTTGLGDGSRIDKDHARIEAIGDIDELNSTIGSVLSQPVGDDIRQCLTSIQHSLFDIGGELSLPGKTSTTSKHILSLEQYLEKFNASLPPLKEFVLPGGNQASSSCHIARAVCRRVERHLIKLSRIEPVNEQTIVYINRLSDLLFVIARILVRASSGEEPQWKKPKL